MMTFTPPEDWQPMPRECRELYSPHNDARTSARFVAAVQQMIDAGEIEVEFRVKNSRYPDARNQYWWRRRAMTLFDMECAP